MEIRQDNARGIALRAWRLATVLVAGLVLASCGSRASPLPTYHGNSQVRGSVVRVERIDSYSAYTLRLLIWIAGPGKPVPVSSDVDLYRITYWSQSGGKPALVSGLMSLPEDGKLRGTVLWMHGTESERSFSLSNGTLTEAVPISGVFAGGGYLLLAPDLVGLGVSKDIQAYFCNPSTIDVTTDFLRAAMRVSRDLGRSWNSNLYIAGFSQGGNSAAVLERAFEAEPDLPWHVKAAAGIAGPYNLSTISIPFALKGKSTGDPVYMSMFALSYSTFYHLPLNDALEPRYAQVVPSLFDGNHTIDDMRKDLPADPRRLFKPPFLATLETGGDNWLSDAARKNEPLGWSPKAPYRAYYGDNDVDVWPADAKTFVSKERARGGNVEAVSIGPYDHEGSVLQAVPLIRAWFDELSARN